MTAHPEMVSGEGRNDLALMRAGRGDWVTKIGAEGVQAHRHPRARASASRSRSPTAPSAGSGRPSSRCWTSCGCSTPSSAPSSRDWCEPVVRNYRGIVTGRVVPSVVLDKCGAASLPCGCAQ